MLDSRYVGDGLNMEDGELDRVVRKLNEAKAISEWHFRDAVEELLLAAEHEPYYYPGEEA